MLLNGVWVTIIAVLYGPGSAQTNLPPIDPAVLEAVKAGDALQKKADYPGALERFRWCAAFSREHNDERGLASCLQFSGGVERLQGLYVEAETDYREALIHAEKANDQTRVSYILNNLANIFGAQGRYPETIAMLQRCIEIDQREGLKDDAAPFQNLAITYALQGDHARALDSFLNALHIYERLGQTDKMALTRYNLGILQVKQNNFAAAKREFLEAQALGEKAGERSVVVQALADLGRLQETEGHTAEARASIQKALEFCRKAGLKSCEGESELNLGNLYSAHRELDSAATAFDAAREIFEPLHDSYNLGQTLRGLGDVARLRKDFPAAAGFASKAFDLSKGIGDPDGQWQSQALLGLIAGDSGQINAARAAYAKAITIIESQRSKVGGGETEQQRFFEKAVYPYQQLAILEASAHRPLDALRAAENARARVLLDMIAGDPERIARAMTKEESDEETRLLAGLAGLNAAMARAPAAAKDSLRARQDSAWGKYEAFRAALYARHPDLRASRGESPVISEEEVAALLPDSRSAIVEFVCARDQTLLLVASRGSDPAHPQIQTFPLAISHDALAARTGSFRALLEQRSPGFRDESRSLFRLLLEPANAALAGKTHIRLVADGPLWELPFQALLDRSGKYWIETVTTSWAPSLTFLRDQSRLPAARTSSLDLLAFADPATSGTASIPLLREQVKKIAALYDANRTVVRTGVAADETTFRRLAPKARVIHLATHGIADPANSMRSRVLLANSPSSPQAGTSQDGWLEAWELMHLDLAAETVILSACETGRGQVAGEGVVGLTWALFVAGARNSVVSQWSVESESTVALMNELHRNLRKGTDPASALRASALSLMKEPRYKHPFYWSAFIAAGGS